MGVGVRAARGGDAAAIADIYRGYVEQTVASFEDVAPGTSEMLGRMQASPKLPWLVAETSERGVVGYAYAAAHRQRAAYRWAVDCSVYIAPAAQRQGVGRCLYEELLPILRRLGYFRAYAGIALPNPGSVRLHESAGFMPVGVYRRVGYKHGAWHDVGWWELSLADVDADGGPPDEPIPWQARRGVSDGGDR